MATVTEKKKGRYKLLRGIHQQAKYPELTNKNLKDMSSLDLKKLATDRGEETGDMSDLQIIKVLKGSETYDSKDPNRNSVESSINLQQKFGFEKFQDVDALAATPANEALNRQIEKQDQEIQKLKAQLAQADKVDLSTMTVKELRKFAADNNIALEDELTKKDEILAVIEFHQEEQ